MVNQVCSKHSFFTGHFEGYFLFSVGDSIKWSCQTQILMIILSEKFSAVVLQWKNKPKAEAFLK